MILQGDIVLCVAQHVDHPADLLSLAATCTTTHAALEEHILPAARAWLLQHVPATLEFRLEDDVLPFGKVFRHEHCLVREWSEIKSFGSRHARAQLLFQPDGEVVGKFLHLVAFKEPWLEGEEPEGHRSCWRGLYVAYPSGGVCIFCCQDCDEDTITPDGTSNVSFEDTTFNDEFMRGLPAAPELPIPTAACVPSPPLEQEPLCRWLLGEGTEEERLRSAQAVSAGFSLDAWASEFVAADDQCFDESGEGRGYRFRMECLEQILEWETRGTWECTACAAISGDFRHAACGVCGLPRL